MIPPETHIADYIEAMPSRTALFTRDIIRNATPAFTTQNRVVQNLTPATSGEEITPLLHQFRLQLEKTDLFGAVISCNEPNTSDGRELDKVEGDIVAFQRKYPNVPLSYFRTEYDTRTPIGKIRLDLANAALKAEMILRPDLKDIVLANCDADTSKLSPYFMQELAEFFMEHPGEPIVTEPSLRHARSGGKLPNMDNVLGWYDAWSHYNVHTTMESHGAMWGSFYALGNGHDPRQSFGETSFLVEELKLAKHTIEQSRLNAVATVSPRKMYDNMRRGESPGYRPVECVREAYRGQDFTTDITPEMADTFINSKYDKHGLIYKTSVAIDRYVKIKSDNDGSLTSAEVNSVQQRLRLLQRTYGGSAVEVEERCSALEILRRGAGSQS